MSLRESKRLYFLQALRAAAAFAVIFAHIGNLVSYDKTLLFDGWIGGIGVDIFFLISGFIMFKIMDDTSAGLSSALQFAARRLGRIMPIYWLVTFGVVVLYFSTDLDFLTNLENRGGLSRYIRSLFFLDFTPIVIVGWTLAYELLFYFICCFSILFFRNIYYRLLTCCAFLSVFFVGNFLVYHLAGIKIAPFPHVVLEFILGGIVYIVNSRFHILPSVGLACGAAAGILLLLIFRSHQYNHGDLPWVAIATLLLIFAVANEQKSQNTKLSILEKLGDASYSTYLIHLYVIIIVNALVFSVFDAPHTQLSLAMVVLAALALIVILSLVLYRYVERPLTKIFTGLFLSAISAARFTGRRRRMI